MKITRVEKMIVLVNCAVPVALLGYDALRGQLGANPVNFAIRTTGLLALIFLVGSLLITPAARVTGANWLVLFRRTIGLYAFFHAALHLSIFFVYDRALSITSTLSEMVLRPYLVVGSAALLLMVPLAVTSTDGMIRRLGPKRWKLLHRLAYVSAALGVLHYYMLVKADVTRPVVFAIVLGLALAFRVAYNIVRRSRTMPTVVMPIASSPAAAAAAVTATSVKPSFWTGQLRVIATFDETHDVRTFRMTAVDRPVLPFTYLPGQYLNLSLQIDGQKVNRSYTIASSPSRGAYCEITVKRDGVASRHLHAAVRVGDVLNVSAPAGRFTFTGAEATCIVMIAGGVGITPLMSKIRYLTDIAWPGDIHLAFAVKTERDLIFADELGQIQRRHPNLHVLPMLTRADAGSTWTGERGRLTAERLLRHAPRIGSGVVHICGPDAMLEPTKQILRELGITDDRIFFESFARPARMGVDAVAPTAAAEATAPPVDASVPDVARSAPSILTFARSGISAQATADQSVLDVAEQVGVRIDFDCRSGICGQCRTQRLTGRVTMDTDDALTPADKADGYILACQAHCVGPVTVDA